MELADRLPFCPRCAYPFTGLPEAHQCPECGWIYDSDSLIWKSPAQSLYARKWVLFGGLVNLLIGIMIIPRGIFHTNFAFRWIFIVGGLVNVVLAAITFRRWWRFAEIRPSFVAIMPDGLWFTGKFDQVRTIPWRRIRSASAEVFPVDKSSGRMVTIHLRSKRRVFVRAGFMSSVQQHDAIARIMVRVEKSIAINSEPFTI